MKHLFLILIIFLPKNSISQNLKLDDIDLKYRNLISDFISSDWDKVYKAKDSLLNIGEPIISILLKLMNEPKAFKKLENIADLIYPGATEFYGHGWVIDYDLDWIAIRAGWALENLTLQNFGFKENVISEKELMELHKNDYVKYIESGKHDVDFQRAKFKQLGEIIERATEWWENNKINWTPLAGLKEAIYSNDLERQLEAIQQMRYPRFKIKGYSQKWFDNEIKASPLFRICHRCAESDCRSSVRKPFTK